MPNVQDEQIQQFIDLCHRAATRYNLVLCSSGNLSLKISEDTALVTGSGFWMSEMNADGIALCRISDGAHLDGVRPSVESRFHLGILRERPETTCVLHFQSASATAFCCCGLDDVNFHILPEMAVYIGDPVVVPYLAPGSEELADAVIEACTTGKMAILQNHGQVTHGTTPEEAIQRAVFFEMVCGLLLRLGNQVRPLPGPVAEDLKNHGYGGKGK